MTDELAAWQESRGFKIGAVVGALILTWAGAAWSLLALLNRAGTERWEFVPWALPVLALTVVSGRRLAAISRLPRRSASDPDALANARRGRRTGIQFGIIFAIEFALIGVTANVLARNGRPLLIPVAVIGIVGAH